MVERDNQNRRARMGDGMSLTHREKEVADLVIKGFSNNEIARLKIKTGSET